MASTNDSIHYGIFVSNKSWETETVMYNSTFIWEKNILNTEIDNNTLNLEVIINL